MIGANDKAHQREATVCRDWLYFVRKGTSMKPVAYAIFAENGNIRMWSETSEPVETLAAKEGLTVTPLFKKEEVWDAALDAAKQQAVKYSEKYGCGSNEWNAAYYIGQYIDALKLPGFRQAIGSEI